VVSKVRAESNLLLAVLYRLGDNWSLMSGVVDLLVDGELEGEEVAAVYTAQQKLLL
jgi:hypothetical protein